MMKPTVFMFISLLLCSNHFVWSDFVPQEKIDSQQIVQKCIKAHGGQAKFQNIQDIYAKLLVKSHTKDGIFESRLYEYFRKPDKLRIDINPKTGGNRTSIGWNGTSVYRLIKNRVEKSNDEKLVNQIQESLRFIRLMILTNLLRDSTLKYEKFIAKKNVHIISQTDSHGEKIWLWISGKNYVLLGARFYFRGSKTPFIVMFVKHRKFGGLLLPRYTKLYRKNSLVMEAWLSLAKSNVLKNRNDFFSDLKQKAKLKSTRSHRSYRYRTHR